MGKLDLKKEQKELYKASAGSPAFVDVPSMKFTMIDGQGDPNTSAEFKNAVESLFPLAYALKFLIKKMPGGTDFTVMPLEGLWWADDMTRFSLENKDVWKWTLMIRQPDFVTNGNFTEAVETVRQKKNPSLLNNITFGEFTDGLSAQILHVGPYADEAPTIGLLHDFIKKNGYKKRGKHREIYLSDMRKCATEKLKTIIRQPVIQK